MQRTCLNLPFPLAVALAAFCAIANGSAWLQSKPSSADGGELLLNVSVRDKSGMPVTGLDRQNFSVLIDNRPAEVASFDASDAPESIGLLVDRSASMRGNRSWKAATHELSRLLGLSNPGSEFFLVSFNHNPKVVAEWTSDSDLFGRSITSVEHDNPGGATSLYDACLLATRKFAQAHHRKKFALLITDGHDTDSTATYSQLHRTVQQYSVPFYCIAIKESAPDNDSIRFARAVVDELTSDTGGIAFFPKNPEQAVYSIETAAQSMRQTYQIGMNKSVLPRDGEYHEISVRVVPTSADKSNGVYVVNAPKRFLAK